jgi:hypothetical protein
MTYELKFLPVAITRSHAPAWERRPVVSDAFCFEYEGA